jgi:hypothetical protein
MAVDGAQPGGPAQAAAAAPAAAPGGPAQASAGSGAATGGDDSAAPDAGASGTATPQWPPAGATEGELEDWLNHCLMLPEDDALIARATALRERLEELREERRKPVDPVVRLMRARNSSAKRRRQLESAEAALREVEQQMEELRASRSTCRDTVATCKQLLQEAESREEALRAEVAARGPAEGDQPAALAGDAARQAAEGVGGILTQLLVLPRAIAAGNHDVAYDAIVQQARSVHRALVGNDGPTLDATPTSPAGPGAVGPPGDAPSASSDVLPETQLRMFEGLSQPTQSSATTSTLVASPGGASVSPDLSPGTLAAIAGGSPGSPSGRSYAQALAGSLASAPADALPAAAGAGELMEQAVATAVPRAMSARMRVDAKAASAKRSPAADRRRTRHGDSSPRSQDSGQGEAAAASPATAAGLLGVNAGLALRQLDLAEVLARGSAALAELRGDAPAAEGGAPLAPAPPAADPGAADEGVDGLAHPSNADGGGDADGPPRG